MRVAVIVVAPAFFLGTSPGALAQNLRDNQVPAIAQPEITKLAQSEWSKLTQTELDCVNQKLSVRGDNIPSLVQRGIFPADLGVVDMRSECRRSSAPASVDQLPAERKFAVDGLALASPVKFDGAAYREYKCSPSQQFDGFMWCQKTRNEKERRGPFVATYSILHAQDGSAVYINRYQEPAFFGRNEADEDIERYARKIGEPARITKKPPQAGLSDGMIALWGKIALEPLDEDSIKKLAEGKSPRKGLLVDFLGNFSRSAKEGLPIYRISGGAGFLWVASFGQRGRGTLRFAAVDASGLVAPLPVQASDVLARTPQHVLPSQQAEAPETNIAELKSAIETAARRAGSIPHFEKDQAEPERQTPARRSRSCHLTARRHRSAQHHSRAVAPNQRP